MCYSQNSENCQGIVEINNAINCIQVRSNRKNKTESIWVNITLGKDSTRGSTGIVLKVIHRLLGLGLDMDKKKKKKLSLGIVSLWEILKFSNIDQRTNANTGRV